MFLNIIILDKEEGQKDWKKLLDQLAHPHSQDTAKCLYLIMD